MRDIRFRAWDKREGQRQMIYSPAIGMPVGINEVFEGSELIWMQFTALHDKQGKEIYEGDIVKFHKGIGTYSIMAGVRTDLYAGQATVEWKAPKFMFKGLSNYYSYSLDDAEVIGNIYENPDLLKV